VIDEQRPGDVNDEATVTEVRAVFERYEQALVANDVDTLDALFWPSPLTVRYGLADVQHGFEAVAAFRRGLPRQTPPRTLRNTVIRSFGPDVAVVFTEFVPEAADGEDVAPGVGRQSQTWVRFGAGWQVAAAHVSWVPEIDA
jgi:uncharacterized protein (TIGR02246 family)